jgi:hypothetical protein
MLALAVVCGLTISSPALVRADEVLDWNAVAMKALLAVPGAPQIRLAAIVHAAVFDAVNGIDRRFTPIHVTSEAPRGASRRAAAVYAAYTTLISLFPAQSDTFDAALQTSLAGIAASAAVESSESIARGRVWGEQVANEILAWRSTDGFDPQQTYVPKSGPGYWVPTPPAFLPGAFLSLATTLPWVIPSPSSFRPAGPPALTSAEYAADFNEVKEVGAITSSVRTADQTAAAQFWSATALTFWNRAATSAALRRHTTLTENARLFALVNVAMADAGISCWDAKYFYEFWRPITAIQMASTDGNPDTEEQADWTSLGVNPPYPDYTSGHATVSGAAQAVLTAYFGNDMPVSGWSEFFGDTYVRSWPNFSAAADEANLARVWIGIHYRFAVVDARAAANAIGAYVMANAAQPVNGRHTGQLK